MNHSIIMGYTVIAPVGENTKAFFAGMKEFPTEKVYLITPPKYLKEANKLAKKLKEFTINAHTVQIGSDVMIEMFRAFGRICNYHGNDNIVVNVATGDSMSTCAAMSAAFANGLRAFGVDEGKIVLMPIMKLSYYDELNARKLQILKSLNEESFICSKKLAEELGISSSLLWYHINGNHKYKGLKELRLVEVKDDKGGMCVKLSSLGSLLIEGNIETGKND